MTVGWRVARGIRADRGLLLFVFAVLIIGLIMVYSASFHLPFVYSNLTATRFVSRQAAFAVLGLLVMWVVSRVDYHRYARRRWALWIIAATVGPQIPLALLSLVTREGWRYMGFGANSVQPSELVKLGGVIYLAAWLSSKRDQTRTISLGLVPFGVLVAVIAAVVLAQRHLSTAALFVFAATAMLYVYGADTKHIILFLAFVVPIMGLMVLVTQYRLDRLRAWLGDETAAAEVVRQTLRTVDALGRGGAFGVGLGQSQEKWVITPAHSDFIFAIIGEEFGYVGSLCIIGLYGFWTWLGLRIIRGASDLFGRLLATGLVGYITLQATLHISVNSGLTPLTGTVLPFISYGGSALMSSLAAVGLLMSIARNASQRQGAVR